jgi:hypothetical protein
LTFQASAAGSLQVEDVYIGKTTSFEDISFTFSGSPTMARFSGSHQSPAMSAGTMATSDWIDLEINNTNNYLVAFKIKNDPDKCRPMAWKNQRTPVPDCRVDGINTNMIFALASVTASYPEKGTYTSQIFDTRLDSPSYGDIACDALLPAGTVFMTKVRSGDQPDLSDANDWSTISASSVNPRSVGVPYSKRYIQFQALMESSSNGLSTPKLKDLTLDWTGDMQLVNISGTITKGPDYGIAEVLVDGMPLQSALSIKLLIYKDVYSLNSATKRVTSSLVADIRPRNTGK